MWITKLLISPVKKRIFCPKTSKIGIFGQFWPGYAGLFNALLWVGWWLWRAGCISQDTYLLYEYHVSSLIDGDIADVVVFTKDVCLCLPQSQLKAVRSHCKYDYNCPLSQFRSLQDSSPNHHSAGPQPNRS